MHLPVSLAGHAAAWRMGGSDDLERWLATRPWASGGGMRLVRLASPESAECVSSAIERTVLGHDNDLSDVRVRRLPVRAGESVRIKLAEDLEVAPEPAFECLRSLSEACTHRSFLFVLDASMDAAPTVLEETVELGERLSKLTDGAAATFIVFDTHANPVSGDFDDFSCGFPVRPVLSKDDNAEAPLWRRYLHTRLAWESAGDWPLAEWLDVDRMTALPHGDEVGFERQLNERAAECRAALAADDYDLLVRYLSALGGADLRSARDLRSRLLERRLVWSPPFGGGVEIVPWAARGWLLEEPQVRFAAALRATLACRPISLEILGACFAMEARLRALLPLRSSQNRPVSAEVASRFARFGEEPPIYERALYPPGSPAVPAEPWAFATLGELLHTFAPKQGGLETLRLLRNAVAHGHHVSWRALRDVLELRSRVAALQ